MTVSAVTLALRPPAAVAGLSGDGSRTLAVRARRVFAVHLLREEQRELAGRFASPATTAAERFAGTDTRQVLGVPVLAGALAWSRVPDRGRTPLRRPPSRRRPGRRRCVGAADARCCWHDRRFGALTEPVPDAAG